MNIYGEGALRDTIQKQIDELKLTNVITLCGRTSNISEKYAQHSIYVMSSRAEGFPLALLEASSCGLPLISYDCPSGPSEIIENGKNGLLVERVGDIQGMADAICTLIENEALRNEMGEKALQMVERFSIQNIKKEWMEVLAGAFSLEWRGERGEFNEDENETLRYENEKGHTESTEITEILSHRDNL